MAKEFETITLTEEQTATAEKLLHQVRAGEFDHPEDIVESYESAEEHHNYEKILDKVFSSDDTLERQTGMIPVEQIEGDSQDRTVNVMDHRLETVLELLLDGKYKKKPERPPNLEKIGDRYYVANDGTHRVIAHRALGIDQMYATYVEPNQI